MARHRNETKVEILHNRYSRQDLEKKLREAGPVERQTLSFYRYTRIENPRELRDRLYREWTALGVLGRIYLAHEGINAQLAVPRANLERFKISVESLPGFENLRFNPGVEDNGNSFIKLIIKVKKYIVNDGLGDFTFSAEKEAPHLTPAEFNAALAEPGTLVVDMRNHYESEVGRFENAICPDVPTFREELPLVADMLSDKKDEKVLIYCTGGIRCEKAGAYLRERGFKNVYQLLGGVINYAHAVKQENLPSKFKGKNFVFDERLGERITDDILSKCHICGAVSDRQLNCANEGCHVLMVQCEACGERLHNCCSEECHEIAAKPVEERRALRRANAQPGDAWFSKKIRPQFRKDEVTSQPDQPV
ncbi:MAG: rhodanese-related sulfurtransferase [Turneriella sp.]|nr:rhodanese-related sulfurtransferase [Turneriella sp.]